MTTRINLQKVAWAVDPYENQRDLQNKVSQILMCLEEHKDIEIYPVYILTQPLWAYTPAENESFTREREHAAVDNLRWLIESLENHRIQKPVILKQTGGSVSSSVDLICEFLEEEGFDMVVVSSHGRSGFKRLIMGSFAETLLLRSSIPVLVIGAKNESIQDIRHILYPSELIDSSEEIFKAVVEFCRDMDARLTIFHAATRPDFLGYDYNLGYVMEDTSGGTMTLHQMFEEELAKKKAKADTWIHWAEYRGVNADYMIESSSHSIDESICEVAVNRNIGMIVMESRTGALEAAVIGSVTRKVVRAARCPVLVFAKNMLEGAAQYVGFIPELRPTQ